MEARRKEKKRKEKMKGKNEQERKKENWLGKTGHRWFTKGPPTQARWSDGGELLFGRFRPTVTGFYP